MVAGRGGDAGGVHIHHLVWGICLMMLCGFLAFAAPSRLRWWHFVASGSASRRLTMDEFALWVRLQDVYWDAGGPRSLDAVVVAAAFAGLVVLATTPYELDDPASILRHGGGRGADSSGLAVTLVRAAMLLGVLGLFAGVALKAAIV